MSGAEETTGDHERIKDLERDLRALDSLYVRREVFDGRDALYERRFKDIEADVAEMKGGWTWLSRIIIGAVIMAVLGLVLIKP